MFLSRRRSSRGGLVAALLLALAACSAVLGAPDVASAHHRDWHDGGPPWSRGDDAPHAGHDERDRDGDERGRDTDWEFGPELEQHLRDMERPRRRPAPPRPGTGDGTSRPETRPVQRPRPRTRPRRRPATQRVPRVPYGRLIAATARRYRLSVALLTALVWQESNFRARARSWAGACGLTQLMPATARMLGVRNVFDPRQNLAGGARYLKAMLRTFRSKRLALAGYNAGPGAVRRYGGVPPYAETRHYVRRVLALEARLRRSGIR